MSDYTIDERNGRLMELENLMLANPKIGVGDLVCGNALGIASGLYEAGEKLLVVRVGESVAKWAGDPSRTVECWSIGADGLLRRTLVDPKMLSVIRKKVSLRGTTAKTDEPGEAH